MTNWHNETIKMLKGGDRIRKSYHIELDDREGYFTLTDERVIFIRVDGFFIKSYKKTLDYFYDEVHEITRKNTHSFELICSDGEKYAFETLGIPAIHIVTVIEYYKKTATQVPSDDQVVTTSQASEVGR
ncbi:hypothetical protein ACFL0D_03490 [Thermoproteota archaeon]